MPKVVDKYWGVVEFSSIKIPIFHGMPKILCFYTCKGPRLIKPQSQVEYEEEEHEFQERTDEKWLTSDNGNKFTL